MTEQEQIEEMARDIYEQKSCDTSFKENCKFLAYDLVALGYQKIDKDTVVLSREEQEKILTATEKRIKELKKQILQARKETAEKILKDFKSWAREYQNEDIIIDDNGERPMTNNEKLNYLYTYLCDKYKVEIKE